MKEQWPTGRKNGEPAFTISLFPGVLRSARAPRGTAGSGARSPAGYSITLLLECSYEDRLTTGETDEPCRVARSMDEEQRLFPFLLTIEAVTLCEHGAH